MHKRDEELFNEWWKKERGDLVGDEGNYSNITATESQLFNWEKQAFIAGVTHARKDIVELIEALEFTLKTAEYLFKPEQYLAPDLPEYSYFTLSYEGDLDLIIKTTKARKLLNKLKEELK